MNFADEAQQEIENTIPVTNFIETARIGFDYIQQKLNKIYINTGEVLLELFNFNVHDPATDNDLLVPVFCLAIAFLRHSQETLENIQPGVYNSLINYTVNQFEIKSQEIS
jgi:hypothetical protein